VYFEGNHLTKKQLPHNWSEVGTEQNHHNITSLLEAVAAPGNFSRVFITKLEYNNITKNKKLHEVL
jgi:hypothetical protein